MRRLGGRRAIPKILPFQTTSQPIGETDEFLDRAAEVVMVFERTLQTYLDRGPDDSLHERVEQVRSVEECADELRRAIANVMHTQALMPDARGDTLSLTASVNKIIDACVHLVVGLSLQRPEITPRWKDDVRELINDVAAAARSVTEAACAYFRDTGAVRDHVNRAGLHEEEATAVALREED